MLSDPEVGPSDGRGGGNIHGDANPAQSNGGHKRSLLVRGDNRNKGDDDGDDVGQNLELQEPMD